MRRIRFTVGCVLAALALGCGGGGGGGTTTYTISGSVHGPARAGVTVTLSGSGSATTTTDASGDYHFDGLANGSYTLTPSFGGGWSFVPQSLNVTVNGANLTGQDFAESGAYAISGTVVGPTEAGVTLTLSGDGAGTAITDANGFYRFTGLGNGHYTVTPSLAGGYVFAPVSKPVDVNGADATGQDFIETGAWIIAGAVSGPVLEGVTMTLSGDFSGTTTTDASGAYEFLGMPDGHYTVTPSLDGGWAFTPDSLAVTVSGADEPGQDFVEAGAFAISGHVTGDVAAGVTVTLSGDGTGSTLTDQAGAYAFTALPNGNYAVTPTLAGYAFAPPSTEVAVNGADRTGRDFTASLVGSPAVTLTGHVAYGGSALGPVYVVVSGPTPGGGTGLVPLAGPWASPRAFSVRGLQLYGSTVTLTAFIDTLGNGQYNSAADPAASVQVTPAATPFDAGTLTLAEPVASTPVAAPAIQGVVPADGAAAVLFKGPQASGGEAADHYRVYWNTSLPVDSAHTIGTVTVTAGPGFGIVTGLANGTAYYFGVDAVAQGVVSLADAQTSAPTTVGPPTGPNTISGTVTYPTPTVTPSALYVVATVQNGGGYVQRIPGPTGTSHAFSISVPDGTYGIIAFIDLHDDGYVGPTEPGFFNDGTIGTAVSVTGGQTASGLALAIPAGNAAARLATIDYLSPSSTFNLQCGVESGAKIPLAAALTGPSLPGPVDLGLSSNGGGNRVSLGETFELYPVTPVLGDAYTLSVTFADGTTQSFPLPVTGVLTAAPAMTAPADDATGVSLTPTFTWDPLVPAPPASSSYVINVYPGAGGDGWTYVMPSSQTSVVYDADGTGPALLPNSHYGWQLAVMDAAGNMALSQRTFTTGP